MDNDLRVYSVENYVKPSSEASSKTILLETSDAIIAVWYVMTGQEIEAHIHPKGQDTWIVLEGNAIYYTGDGVNKPISKGQVVVARPGEIHGVMNTSNEPLIFVSVLSPRDAGYKLSTDK